MPVEAGGANRYSVKLLYFGHLPMEGAGSAIIVLRHLRRLQASGWNIQVVGDWGQDASVCRAQGWPVHWLPHRRWWWPPYRRRNAWSARLQHWLWAGEAHKAAGRSKPDAVLTYLSAFSDTLSQAAAAYATRYQVPLTTLVHDDFAVFLKDRDETSLRHERYRWVLQASAQNWFVSPELATAYGFADPQNRNVLMPISEGWTVSAPRKPPSESCLLVYAGNARDPQIPVLERMARLLEPEGMRLLVLADRTPALAAALERSPLLWRQPFATNREALAWLQCHATALLVAYADRSDDQPWVRSSFPSKLVEFAHLGMPVLLAAPDDSAVASWATRSGWQDWIRPDDAAGLLAFAKALRDLRLWQAAGQRALSVAKEHFDPDGIQAVFEQRLALSGERRDESLLTAAVPLHDD